MMTIAKVNQVPIQQPMYVNGMLHQVWIRFFEKLGAVVDETGVYILPEMNQSIVDQGQLILNIQTNIQNINTALGNINSAINTLNTNYTNLEARVAALEAAP